MPTTMKEFIEEIKQKVSIKDIIEKRTQLIPAGSDRYKCLSPFTKEKTPSMSVDDTPGKRFWYCFSTKQGGGVIPYLMLAEGMSKGEAIRYIAAKYNIALPQGEKEDPQADHKMLMRKCLKDAQRYFISHKQGAIDYVASKKYPLEIVEKYQMGFAPDSWDALKDYMMQSGYTPELLIECGLIMPRKNGGGYFSRYRNRVMFPITDIYGEINGFTGRTAGDETPKYLHVPNSMIFRKEDVLWNFDAARKNIKDQKRVFVGEGNFDAILADNYNFPATCTLGSKISDNQLKILAGVAENIYMIFDNDAAGRDGMVDMFQKIEEKGYDTITYAITIPQSEDVKDVADYIRVFGADKFQELVNRAVPDTSVVVEYYRERNFDPRATKAALSKKVLSDILPFIKKVRFSYRSSDLIERTAQILNVDKKALETWINDGTEVKHNSSTYKKIESMTFPSEIYERRIMTECMKDPTKWHILREMGLSTIDFEYLPSKVMTAIEETENPANVMFAIKQALTDEEYHTVMGAYGLSFTENLDVLTLGAIMVSKVKGRRGDNLYSDILGRPMRQSKAQAIKALSSLTSRRN